MATGRQIGRKMRSRAPITSVACGPDNTILVVNNHKSVLWTRLPGKSIGQPLTHPEGRASVAAFNPDGKTLITCGLDRTTRLWDAATGSPIGHQSSTPARSTPWRSARTARPCSPATIPAAPEHGTRQHGIPSGKPCGILAESGAAAFSPDGTAVATGCEDGMARVGIRRPQVSCAVRAARRTRRGSLESHPAPTVVQSLPAAETTRHNFGMSPPVSPSDHRSQIRTVKLPASLFAPTAGSFSSSGGTASPIHLSSPPNCPMTQARLAAADRNHDRPATRRRPRDNLSPRQHNLAQPSTTNASGPFPSPR